MALRGYLVNSRRKWFIFWLFIVYVYAIVRTLDNYQSRGDVIAKPGGETHLVEKDAGLHLPNHTLEANDTISDDGGLHSVIQPPTSEDTTQDDDGHEPEPHSSKSRDTIDEHDHEVSIKEVQSSSTVDLSEDGDDDGGGDDDDASSEYIYNEPLRFDYQPKGLALVEGLPFNIDIKHWVNLHGLPLRNFVKPSLENAKDMVFVTGASSDYVEASMDAIASIQKHFPKKKILYYDWGLDLEQRKKIQQWCQVEVKEFNFAAYPVQHTMSDSTRAKYQTAKIFAIIQALHDYPTVMWIDTSVRFHSGDLSAVNRRAIQNSGLVFLVTHSFSSTFEVTHPSTFKYLPTNVSAVMFNDQVETSAFLIMRTEKIYSDVIWWLYLCSLVKDCIAPILNQECRFMLESNNWETRVTHGYTYQNCHHMELSVLNILAGNLCKFDVNLYALEHKERIELVETDKKARRRYTMQNC